MQRIEDRQRADDAVEDEGQHEADERAEDGEDARDTQHVGVGRVAGAGTRDRSRARLTSRA